MKTSSKLSLKLVILFCPLIMFAQPVPTTNSFSSSTFPFSVNFSDTEIQYLRSLSETDLQKLVQIATQIRNRTTANTSVSTSPNNSSGNLSGQTPIQNGAQTNPNPAGATAPISYGNPNYVSTPQTNPYYGSAHADYYAAYQRNYGNSPTGGYDQPAPALTASDMRNIPALGSGGQNCSNNYGVDGNLSGTTAKLKFDLSRLCNAFGRRIKVVSAYRSSSAAAASQHLRGAAADIEIRRFGSNQEQALLVVAFIALGYNIGSYQRNFPIHVDHEQASYWKTWSYLAGRPGSARLTYDQAVRDALSLIGRPAENSGDFRSRYGRPTRQDMSQRARAYLQTIYGEAAGRFTPSQL